MTEKQIQKLIDTIIEFHWHSYLSEGQAAKLTGLTRVEIRKRLEELDEKWL